MKFQNREPEVKVMEDPDLQGAYRQAEGGCRPMAAMYPVWHKGFPYIRHTEPSHPPSMRLIHWNCLQSFRKKHGRILELTPDIVVVCECENEERLQFGKLTPRPTDFIWHGELPAKGLGVFSYSDYRLEIVDGFNPEFRHVVPIRVNNKEHAFILLATWTQKGKNGAIHTYIDPVWNAIHYYDQLFSEPIVLVGDLNSNVLWNKKGKTGNHSDVVGLLAERGIHSLYHLKNGLMQGNEPDPTFYLYRHKDKAYHIDYCFAHESLLTEDFNIEVGKHEDWCDLSDHVPLIIDL